MQPTSSQRSSQSLLRLVWSGLFFLCLSLFVPLFGQCLEGDCSNGEGSYRYTDGRRYTGEFLRGKPNGEGALYFTNGERYLGQFYQGQPQGQGVYWYPDGSFRRGLWSNGLLVEGETTNADWRQATPVQLGCIAGDCLDGTGTYLLSDGSVYVGQFRGGEIHGQGVCEYADGSRYEGQWNHRYPHGFGTRTWPDGRSFTGQWEGGIMVSKNGVFQTSDSAMRLSDGRIVVQSGCLRGNCENGQGLFAYADGSRYEGGFLSGQPHGQGIFYYPSGEQHRGQFAYGLAHGRGRRTLTDGTVKQGEWVEGGFRAPRTAVPDKGCLSGNCQDGYGIYRFQQGDRYEGTFLDGKPEGHGLVQYQNGDRYEGEMQAGAFTGFGTFYEHTGAIYEGRWQAGQYLGNTRLQAAPVDDNNSTERETKTWALVIGVASYRHMPPLRFTDDDAYRLYAFLQSPQGGAIPDERIAILIDEDATRQNIIDAMEHLFLRAGPEDLVILYFSGHGLPGAFLPIDYNGVNNALTHLEIKQLLDQSAAGYKLCLADACHSGGLLAVRGGQLPGVLTRYYDNLSEAKQGTALIMSSKAEETSLESSGLRQGVFSHFLLRGLKGEADQDGDTVVRVQELYNYIQQQVTGYTHYQQSPVIQGSYDERMPVGVVRY